MSRSLKRSPFRGVTTASSEKDWKRHMARVARRRPLDAPPPKRCGDRSGPKDGKRRFDPVEKPEFLRK